MTLRTAVAASAASLLGVLVLIPHASVAVSGAAASTETQSIAASNYIVVDQFGYLPDGQKVAVIRDPQVGFDAAESFTPSPTFALVNASTGVEVFTGPVTAWNDGEVDDSSGDKAFWFDFSSVQTPGAYYVLDKGNLARSAEFRISEAVYHDVLKAAVRTFFYQRAGQSKDAQYAGEAWADGASHMGPLQDTNARRYHQANDAATERDLSGGWYDSGDYNKYTNWHAQYVTTLLRAYSEAKDAFSDDYGIPESGNGVPDVVDEAKWGMDWLTRMQNADGSVLSIVGVGHASPPSAATGPSLYGEASTSATLSAASAFALGSTVFRSLGEPSLTQYADDLLARAEWAWTWAIANPSVTFFNNDSGSGTDGLGSGQQETDDYGWLSKKIEAAVHLFEATGWSAYREFVDSNYQEMMLIASGYAYPFEPGQQDALLHYASMEGATASVSASILGTYKIAMEGDDNFRAIDAEKDPYRAYLKDYTWGSNGTKSHQGNMYWNISLHGVNPDRDAAAKDAAAGYLHYLHGTNPLGIVYLSNMGELGAENSVNEFFHTWFADGSEKWDRVGASVHGPPPGFLTGGPNPGYDWDGCCPGDCGGDNDDACPAEPPSPPGGQPAQKSYKDFNTSWPLNSWTVTENSNGYQVAYIRLLSKFVTAKETADGVGSDPMTVISLGKPAFASGGVAEHANDADYDSTWAPGGEGWLAYDLSSVPAESRESVLLAWYSDADDGYTTGGFQGTCAAWHGRQYLSDYTIEVNAAQGGSAAPANGWEVAATVVGNRSLGGQHVIDFEGRNWIRINGGGPNDVSINVDVADASGGVGDGWLFVGDSITARYAGHDTLTDPAGSQVASIGELVSSGTGGVARPLTQNGGMSCAKSSDALSWIDTLLGHFPGKYVTLNFGTNDGWAGSGDAEEYYRNMEALVKRVTLMGKVPVVATIPWSDNGGDWEAGTVAMNAQIKRLYEAHPEVVEGPDLFTLLKGRPELFGPSGDVHPNGEGAAVIRRGWADAIIKNVYGAQNQPR